MGDQEEQGQEDGAHRVDVGHGVQGDAAQHPGGGVAVQQGHVTVGHFMDDDGKEQHHGHEGRFQEVREVHPGHVQVSRIMASPAPRNRSSSSRDEASK